MVASVSRVWVHLVFSTKYRAAVLSDRATRRRLYSYQSAVLQRIDCAATIVNGVADHVHLLFELTRTSSIASVVEEVKRASSKWVRENFAGLGNFSWQRGYAIFSVSESDVPRVRAYIENQEQHHLAQTFKDELLEHLSQHGETICDDSIWE